MSYNIILQLEAIQDMQEAFSWYEQQKAGLGYSFIERVEKCFQKISENPEYGGMLNKWIRRTKVKGFPYIILYETEKKTVFINSVFHTSKSPRY